MPAYWYSGSQWNAAVSMSAYSGSQWNNVERMYIYSGSDWRLFFGATQYYLLVADNAYSTNNIDCLGTPYAGGLVTREIKAELVDINQSSLTNDTGQVLSSTIEFTTFYNNGCGSPGTITLNVDIPTGSATGSSLYTAEQVAECGFGCGTEGQNNPCIDVLPSGILLHPSSSLEMC